MTSRYHPSTCGRWIIEVIPDDPHGEARILSLEDASDKLAMHKRLQMDFLELNAMATAAPAATRQRRSGVDPGYAAGRNPSTWEGGMTEADLDPLGKLAVREVRPAYVRRLGDPKPWLETFRLGAELAGAGALGWAILHSIGLM